MLHACHIHTSPQRGTFVMINLGLAQARHNYYKQLYICTLGINTSSMLLLPGVLV